MYINCRLQQLSLSLSPLIIVKYVAFYLFFSIMPYRKYNGNGKKKLNKILKNKFISFYSVMFCTQNAIRVLHNISCGGSVVVIIHWYNFIRKALLNKLFCTLKTRAYHEIVNFLPGIKVLFYIFRICVSQHFIYIAEISLFFYVRTGV